MTSTTQIVLPPLTRWAEDSLSQLYTAKSQGEFNAAFDGFISPKADIVVNGTRVSREEYRDVLQKQRTLEREARVKVEGVVSTKPPQVNVPEKDVVSDILYSEMGVEWDADALVLQPVGLVGMFYDAIISEKPQEGGVPVSRTVKSSLNLA